MQLGDFMRRIKINNGVKIGTLYLIGNIFNKAIAFITIPIFTRLLTTEEYGIVNTYTSWASILMVIVGLSLGNSVRNAFVDYKDDLAAYLSSIFTLSFLNFVLMTLISTIICLSTKVIPVSLLLCCFFEAFGTFVINAYIIRYMMSEEAGKRTMLMVLPNLFGSILSVVLIFLLPEQKYYGRIISTCIVSFGVGMALYLNTWRKSHCFYSKEYWIYSLKLCIPLIFHGLSVTILNASDKTIITMLCGASQTGIYSLVHNFGMIAMVITASLDSMWVPHFTRKMLANDIKGINQFSFKYILVLAYVFVGILLVGPEVLIVLAPAEYWEGAYIIAPFVIASYFQFLYTLSVNAEFYYKKTKMVAKNTIVAAILNIILNFTFIPLFGYQAAAYTTAVSYFVSLIMHSWYCKRLNKELFPLKIYFLPTIIIVLATIYQYVFMYNWIARWGMIVSITIILLFMGFKLFKENRKRGE